MERYSRLLPLLGLALAVALAVPAVANADPPAVTVWFGTPSERRGEASGIQPTEAPNEAPNGAPTEAPNEARAPRRAPPSPTTATAPVAECPATITIVRRHAAGLERVHMPMLDCEGLPRDEARLAVSLLARPRSLEEPPTEDTMRAWLDADGDPELLAEGVHWIHPGLLERLQRIGEAFEGSPIEVVSGYRPESPSRSRHHHGRALDLVVQGVPREALRDLAVTFPQTGVGWYPNSAFVHVDVREESAYWVDLSGPGERPRYVRGATPPVPGESTDPGDPGEPARDATRPAAGPAAVPAAARPAARAAARPVSTTGREELERIRRSTEEALRQLHIPAP